jgi:hypothetical protein
MLQNGLKTSILREPDASFGHTEAQYPGVVIEIAYSRKRQAVRDLLSRRLYFVYRW